MLIKSVDDKSRRITFLLNLYDSPMLNAEQKQWLDDELWSSRRKFLAVETAASHIDSCFAESKDYAVLHDLRLRLRDGAVRIDHLLLARNCAFVIETRNFEGDITIDMRGDFTIQYADGKTQLVSSPIKRGKRLEAMLQEFFDALGIKVRGAALPVHHLAMFPDDSTIRRPPASELDSSSVIQSQVLKSLIEEMCASHAASKLKTFWSREKDSLNEWAEKIVSHHHPDNPFFLPKSIRPPKRRKTDEEVQMAAESLPPAENAAQPLVEPVQQPPAESLLPANAGTAPVAAAPQEQTAAPADEPTGTLSPEEAAEAVPQPVDATENVSAEAGGDAPEAAAEPLASTAVQENATVPMEHEDGAEAQTEFLDPHLDDAEAPTMFLERDAETPTEFLERDTLDSIAPTMFLERDATDTIAPTQFLERDAAPAAALQPATPAIPAVSTCALCGRPLMRGMVKFCQEHPKRFGGQLYCFTHQDNFPPVPEEDA